MFTPLIFKGSFIVLVPWYRTERTQGHNNSNNNNNNSYNDNSYNDNSSNGNNNNNSSSAILYFPILTALVCS